jgi:methylenetetrahydrofolate reductase (NADPH)
MRMAVDRNTAPETLRRLVGSLVAGANLEVIPLKGSEAGVAGVPATTTVTITCSPKFGLQRSLDHVAAAVRGGHRVVPHLAARMVTSEDELRGFVTALSNLGVQDLYVIAGDGDTPLGEHADAESILLALRRMGVSFQRIGVACYPEGHPKIGDGELMSALVRKQRYADYMISQLCFDPVQLSGWLGAARRAGVTLPLRVGLAAPMKVARLVELSMKIGVGQSLRYLTKQKGLVGNLLLGRNYAPEQLLLDLGADLASAEMAIEGVHVFSFNQIEACLTWQRDVAESFGARGIAAS